MTIDKLFASLGVNVDPQSVQRFVVVVTDATKEIKKKANEASDELNQVASSAANAAEKAGKQTKTAINPLLALKRIATSVVSAISSAATSVFSFVTSGVEGAKKLAKEKGLLYKITNKELKQANEYSNAMQKAGQFIELIKTKIALGFAPALTEVIDSFYDWIKLNKEFINEGLTVIIYLFTKFIQVIVNTIEFIHKVISATVGWKTAIMIIVAALAIFKRAMLTAFLTNPIGWVILAIAGLLLLIDDLMVYLKGGKSKFAGFWEPAVKWVKEAISWWKEWLENVEETLNEIKDAFSRAFSRLAELTQEAIDGIKAVWEGIKAFFSNWTEWLKELFNAGLAAIESIWEGLKNTVKEIFDKLGDLASKAVDAVKTAFSAAIDYITAPFKSAIDTVKNLFDGAEGDADKFIAGLEKSFNNVIDAITKPFKAAFDWVMEAYEKTVGKISGAWESIKGGASSTWDSIKNGASGMLESGKNWVNLSDTTSAPNPQNSSGNINNRSEVNIHSEGVKAEITINATNVDEARIGVEAGLNSAEKHAFARLSGVNGS